MVGRSGRERLTAAAGVAGVGVVDLEARLLQGVDEVELAADEKSALYLVGSVLDFVDTLQESGFKIENPNASNTCGCGQSFAA